MSGEIWAVLPSNPKYLISSAGAVRHCRAKTDRKPSKLGPLRKYLAVSMVADGNRVLRTVHGLVAETFLGPRPLGSVIRHLDGNPSNNSVSNLTYGTPKENADDRQQHGRTKRGEKNGNAKLSDADADFVRLIYASKGASQYELATRFGISQSQINNIVLLKQRRAAA